ncbi:hypothetical protein K8R33_01295 [archaeon]|nr:hypothetical protein [archaeon]
MDNVLLSFILALPFLVNWFLQYHFSKKVGELSRFKKHFATFYLDWLFLPFNILWPFVVLVAFNHFLIILLFVFIVNILMHIYWVKTSIVNGKEKSHIFHDRGSLKKAGYTHFIFSTIEASLIISFLIFNASIFWTYISSMLLLFFFLGGIISSKKIHGKVIALDWLLILGGILFVILSLLFF